MQPQGQREEYDALDRVENRERAAAERAGELGAYPGAPYETALYARAAADTAQAAADAAQASADAAASLASNGILAIQSYDFGQGSNAGWTLVGCTAADAEYATCRRLTGSGANPALNLSGLSFDPLDVHIVAMRVRLVSGTWRGELYYSKAGHGLTDPYKLGVAAPSIGVWKVLVFDLRGLADFMTGGNTTAFQFQFTTDAGVMDVDWIAVGKAGAGLADVMKSGSYTLGELKATTLSALGRSSDLVSVWYRGNSLYNPPGGTPGGVPVLIDPPWTRSTTYAVGDRVSADPVTANTYPISLKRDGAAAAARQVYVCATAGTTGGAGYGPTGTTTQANWSNDGPTWAYVGTIASQERLTVVTHQSHNFPSMDNRYGFTFTLQPLTDRDNLDALRGLEVDMFDASTNHPPTGAAQYEIPVTLYIPDRRYRVPGTPGDSANASKVTHSIWCYEAIYYAGGTYPFNGYLRVTLHNLNGASRTRDFNFTGFTAAGTAGAAGEFTLGGASGGSGGGAGGGADGGCTAPETLILLGPGLRIPIGDLRAGDFVWTSPEDGGPVGYHRVEWVKHVTNSRLRLTMEDGRSLVCSINHRLHINGAWVRADSLHVGQVISGECPGIIASIERLGVGPVVQCMIPTAHTYRSADGLWMHNILKP